MLGRSDLGGGPGTFLFVPVGRQVAPEIEEALERVENLVASAAADPALRNLELILDDAEDSSARGAARRQTHREIMPRASRFSDAGHEDPAIVDRVDAQCQPRRIGLAQLVGLTFENAREHEAGAGFEMRCKQWRQKLER